MSDFKDSSHLTDSSDFKDSSHLTDLSELTDLSDEETASITGGILGSVVFRFSYTPGDPVYLWRSRY